MGFGNQAPSADGHLKEKISLALTAQIVPLIDDSTPAPTVGLAALANAINSDPRRALDRLHPKLKTNDGITNESTYAELDTAVVNATSQEMLFQVYGIPTS